MTGNGGNGRNWREMSGIGGKMSGKCGNRREMSGIFLGGDLWRGYPLKVTRTDASVFVAICWYHVGRGGYHVVMCGYDIGITSVYVGI